MPTVTLSVSISEPEYAAALRHFAVADARGLQAALAHTLHRQLSAVRAGYLTETAEQVKQAFLQGDASVQERMLAFVPPRSER